MCTYTNNQKVQCYKPHLSLSLLREPTLSNTLLFFLLSSLEIHTHSHTKYLNPKQISNFVKYLIKLYYKLTNIFNLIISRYFLILNLTNISLTLSLSSLSQLSASLHTPRTPYFALNYLHPSPSFSSSRQDQSRRKVSSSISIHIKHL